MALREITSLSIRRDVKERAVEAVKRGIFPGIRSLSGLVEFALEEVLKKVEKSLEEV